MISTGNPIAAIVCEMATLEATPRICQERKWSVLRRGMCRRGELLGRREDGVSSERRVRVMRFVEMEEYCLFGCFASVVLLSGPHLRTSTDLDKL